MSNFQRGIYRPLADMVPIYHLADKDPEERSRAPLLVIIVLVVLSAFAGVVWLAYNRVERGRQDLSLVITAPSPAAPAPATTAARRPAVVASRLTPAAAPAVAPTAQAAKPAPRAAAPAATSRAVSGAAVLQLGVFESQELANGAWAGFRARFNVLVQLAPDIQRVDLGAKGIVYRLRAGPFADRTAAVEACTQLKAAGGNCFVAAP